MTDAGFSLRDYDFADFGSSSGKSIDFAIGKLGGVKGIGFDISAAKVEAARAVGRSAHVADVTKLDPKGLGTVRFVVMAHFLEHLPDAETAAKCIRSGVQIADEFVFILQPFFDADDYLAALGLRLYWSNWRGHKNHMRSLQLRAVLEELLASKKIQRYIIFQRTRIADSNDPAIHPLGSPAEQHAWDPAKHPPKPSYNFSYPVYREIGAIIHTRSKKLDEKPRRFLLSCEIVHDSAQIS